MVDIVNHELTVDVFSCILCREPLVKVVDIVNHELTVDVFSCILCREPLFWKRCLNSGQIDVISMEVFCSNRRRFSWVTQWALNEMAAFTGELLY